MTGRPVAMVTGAARRVGRAIARSLAESAFDLILTYHHSHTEATETARDLATLGAGVRLEQLDLSDLGAVAAFGARLGGELPRLDVLVHNASVYGPSPVAALDAGELLRNYRVNAGAPLLLSAALAPLLSRSPLPGGGCIVAMCDIHAMGRPRRDFAAYSMSKAALAEMVRSLARDLAPGVRVCGVAPGVIAFPEHGPDADPEAQQRYLSRVPLGRSGTPRDAAEVVRWLALDAHYVTGEIVRLDGGRWLA
ncbi:MAG: SDR family oxidoreductase [Phycisphaerales bacterium]|nr:SDR family oxidoreductase [Phycisphaerales bacterium]